MDGKSFAASLKAAVDEEEPWFTIAGLVIDGGPTSKLDERRGLALKEIELSSNLLGRYISVLRRLREIAELHNVPVERLLSPVFSATEIAVRIYDRAPNLGLESLNQLKERRTTLIKLRSKLEDIELSSQQLEKARKGSWIEEQETALKTFAVEEFGASSQLTRRPALKPFARIGWIVLGKDRLPKCGIDLFDPAEKHVVEAALVSALALSTFFKRFFVMFPAAAEEETVARAVAMLDFFRANSVGTLYGDIKGGVKLFRAATGSPTPDRSSDYASLESMFAYGRFPRLYQN
jgi:hypothetical protein